MYCPQCGTKNEDDSKFCGGCGFRMDQMDESPAKPASSGQSPGYQQPPSQQPSGYRQQPSGYQQQPQGYQRGPQGYQPSGYKYGAGGVIDEVNPLAYICSFCFFPAGIVIWLSIKDAKPRSAQNIGYATIAGFILAILFGI